MGVGRAGSPITMLIPGGMTFVPVGGGGNTVVPNAQRLTSNGAHSVAFHSKAFHGHVFQVTRRLR